MATINLIEGLKLIRQFGDSPAVVSVIDKTIEELERLQEIERHAATLAAMMQNGVSENSIELAIVVSKLVEVE